MESSLAPSFLDDDDDYDDEESIESLLPVDYDDEMQKYPDTGRVRCWRTSVTLTLLLTAIVVSLITYRFLMGKQIDTFETAYSQFADTVIQGVTQQQETMHKGEQDLATLLSSLAQASNQEWPFFTDADFASQAQLPDVDMVAVATRVSHANRAAYQNYTTNQLEWVQEAHMQIYGNLDLFTEQGFTRAIHTVTDEFALDQVQSIKDEYFPYWLVSPPPMQYNILNVDASNKQMDALLQQGTGTILGPVSDFTGMLTQIGNTESSSTRAAAYTAVRQDPHNAQSEIVAIMVSIFAWDTVLDDMLPTGVNGITAVLENTCNQTLTFALRGSDGVFVKEGDVHETSFNDQERIVSLSTGSNTDNVDGDCAYSMKLYPTQEFRDAYDNGTPEVYACILAVIFALVALVYFCNDIQVQKRTRKLLDAVARSNAAVTSMFPSHIRDQILQQQAQQSSKMKSFLNHDDGLVGQGIDSKPLADLFLETTVVFADIVGFTAWSSMREPSQIFMLLETVFRAFDKIAKCKRIFKVETVADCYVAVAGLPEPRRDHAVAAARFAFEVMRSFAVTVKHLELTLGPDTSDLNLRIGIHSGPVTAGVLRGERSRFQLFGDTMNMTSCMESTGRKGDIQCSQTTADLLALAEKKRWLAPRPDPVAFRGKGKIQTYWVSMNHDRAENSSNADSQASEASKIHEELHEFGSNSVGDKQQRLIDWNTETLLSLLKQVVARRDAQEKLEISLPITNNLVASSSTEVPLDEVLEIIELPEFSREVARKQKKPERVQLDNIIVRELREYVSTICGMYKDNPFHNFEHASHVVMSVTKMLSRIVALELESSDMDVVQPSAQLHDHTYGITSDPLTQFACAFSALIHDVDHSGVPNTQLMKEQSALAKRYKKRSVAEQNSLDLSWNLLQSSAYSHLRAALAPTKEEMQRFRALCVNSVMATDIADKDLKQLRNSRWERAFDDTQSVGRWSDDVNRKATIVIEHLIQASDVSHTMQHWHVYRKWNQCLFEELYKAYKQGRATMDPTKFWYRGELGFFDHYIMPLAKKLKECGVFGKTSDEFLNYATQNRQEWELRGKEVVAEMVEELAQKY